MSPFRLLITGINGRIGVILRNALENFHDVFGEAVARYYCARY
jgi:hypothetical protein